LTSDICMFSSIIGYLADPKRDLAELELRLHEDLEPDPTTRWKWLCASC
jgi:hypothetical protein